MFHQIYTNTGKATLSGGRDIGLASDMQDLDTVLATKYKQYVILITVLSDV